MRCCKSHRFTSVAVAALFSIKPSKAPSMPKVLLADKLSPAAVAIFRERGVEADVKTGLAKEELLKIVDQYDAIAIRSATKLTADVLKAAKNLKVVGRAR